MTQHRYFAISGCEMEVGKWVDTLPKQHEAEFEKPTIKELKLACNASRYSQRYILVLLNQDPNSGNFGRWKAVETYDAQNRNKAYQGQYIN